MKHASHWVMGGLALANFAFGADVGSQLTPIGAEIAGNVEGSIPVWDGGLLPTRWPAGYKVGGKLVDPYADDKPTVVITAANYRNFAMRLSQGHQTLFAKYSDYTLPIYPTRRSVSFPEEIYAATKANAATAKLAGIDSIEGARLGIPFPQPRSGVEVLWNHRLRYHGDAAEWHNHRALVWADGSHAISQQFERVLYRYANVKDPSDDMYALSFISIAPFGEYHQAQIVWHDPVNALSGKRRFWNFYAGHTYTNPPFSHDEISFDSGRIRQLDMWDMFNGGFDRYVFKLVGKREMYVPYNSYRLSDGHLKNAQVLTPKHFNQAEARYELHRVWIVEASLRPGQQHTLAKRIFYVDEDSWSILLVDCYDKDGKLTRFQEGHFLPLYPVQGVDYAPTLTYDLKDAKYFADFLLSEDVPPNLNLVGAKPSDFSPEAAKNRADEFLR